MSFSSGQKIKLKINVSASAVPSPLAATSTAEQPVVLTNPNRDRTFKLYYAGAQDASFAFP